MSVYVKQNGNARSFNSSNSWTIMSPLEQDIKSKIEAHGIPLKDWNITINRGILTGMNEAFIIDGAKRDELISEDPKSAELIRPILRGKDIKRYGYNFADLWLINVHNGIKEKGVSPIDIKDFPAIKNHLDKYYSKLSIRSDKGDTPYNLRNCAYMDEFSKQKIMYNDINQRLSFCLVPENWFCNNTVYFISDTPKSKYLIAFLNSKVIDWYYKSLSVQLGKNAVRMFSIYVEEIPIPHDISVNHELESLVDLIQVCDSELERRSASSKIDEIVFDAYGLSDEERDFISSQYDDNI